MESWNLEKLVKCGVLSGDCFLDAARAPSKALENFLAELETKPC